MANPVIQSKDNQAFTLNNTVTITKPTGTVDGDFLVAFISFANGNETITSVPSGWTAQATEYTGNTGLGIYTKVAGGSEPANYAWTVSGSNIVAGGSIFRVDNQASGNEVAGTSIVYQSTGDTDMTETVSVAPDSGETLAFLCFFSIQSAGTGNITTTGYASTPSVTYTEEYDFSYELASDDYFAMAIASGPYDGTTTFTSIGATASVTPDNYRSAIILINAPQNETVTSSLLAVDPTLTTSTPAADTNPTSSLLSVDPTLNTSTPSTTNPTTWTTTIKS